MGIGYLIGCLFSILLWKIDRQNIFYKINKYFKKIIKNSLLLQIFYITLSIVIVYIFYNLKDNEFINILTAFLVIDISNTERKNLQNKENFYFYDSISTISQSVVCGFIAPIFYIIIFNNALGILYFLIYNLYMQNNFKLFKLLFNLTTIIPCFIAQIFLYIFYIIRNKKLSMDFKGDYFLNILFKPLLNIDIMAAYIESVNFCHYFSHKNKDYIKNYGDYTNKIDDICVKDYLSITYAICMLSFILFFLIILRRYFNFI